MKSVVAVVLSWNHRQAVLDCIDRVKTLTGADLHIVIVDNASSDGSVDAIRAAHPDVTVIEESTNRGFAGGVNLGLAEAARRGAEYAWLLNDDTLFDSTALGLLLEHAQAPAKPALLTPLLSDLEEDGNALQFVNGSIDWRRGAMVHNEPPIQYIRTLADGATPIVPGTALLCDMRVYRAIGPFDTRFFAYWEDTDYAVRAVDAGFLCAVVDASHLQHAATRNRLDRPSHYHYYMVRNEALFFRLHGRRHRTAAWRRRWLGNSLEWLAQNRDLSREDNALACIDGIWHAVTHRHGARADHRSAPAWLRRFLMSRPWLLTSLVRGEWSAVAIRLLHPR